MPTKKDNLKTPEVSQDDFLTEFMESRHSVQKRDASEIREIMTWANYLHANFIEEQYDEMMDKIFNITSHITDNNKIIATLEDCKSLAVLTIATGATKRTTMIHNITNFHIDNDLHTLGLIGTQPCPNVVELNLNRTFKMNKENVPTTEAFANWEIFEDRVTKDKNSELREYKFINNTIVLPPLVTSLIIKNTDFSATTLFKQILAYTKAENHHQREIWKQEKGITTDEEEDDIEEFATTQEYDSHNNERFRNPFVETMTPLLQTLWFWSTLKNKKDICYEVTTHPAIYNWQMDMVKAMAENKLKKWKTEPEYTLFVTNNEDDTQNETNQTYTPPNHVRFEGDNENNNNTDTNTRTQNNRTDPNITNTPQHANAPNNTTTPSTTTTQHPQPTPNTNTIPTQQQQQTFTLLSQQQQQIQWQDSMMRIAMSFEKFTNDQASHLKQKDEGTTKIPNAIKTFMLNASTPDGEHPAQDITIKAKEIMSSKGEAPSLILNQILQSERAKAKPTPRFLRGASKGLWTFTNGTPDNCCIMNLPPSLGGSGLDNVDLNRLQDEEANGRTMSEKERELLNKSVTIPCKNITWLQKKTKSWFAITKHLLGENSIAAGEADNWNMWVEENSGILEDIQRDKDQWLPARIECFICDSYCRFFEAAKYSIPSESHLLADDVRTGLIRGTIKPDIPKQIMSILNPEKKRQQNNQNNNGNGDKVDPDQKKRLQKQTHENQPKDIKMSKTMYAKVMAPAIREKKIKMPDFTEGCAECGKYIFEGECNTNCWRSKAHEPVKENTKRHKDLKKARDEALKSYNASKGPNDQNFD